MMFRPPSVVISASETPLPSTRARIMSTDCRRTGRRPPFRRPDDDRGLEHDLRAALEVEAETGGVHCPVREGGHLRGDDAEEHEDQARECGQVTGGGDGRCFASLVQPRQALTSRRSGRSGAVSAGGGCRGAAVLLRSERAGVGEIVRDDARDGPPVPAHGGSPATISSTTTRWSRAHDATVETRRGQDLLAPAPNPVLEVRVKVLGENACAVTGTGRQAAGSPAKRRSAGKTVAFTAPRFLSPALCAGQCRVRPVRPLGRLGQKQASLCEPRRDDQKLNRDTKIRNDVVQVSETARAARRGNVCVSAKGSIG